MKSDKKAYLLQLQKPFYYSLGIFSLFIVWFIISVVVKNSLVFPSIKDTFKACGEILSRRRTYISLGITLGRLFIVISVSFVLAFFLAYLSYLYKRVYYFFMPFTSIFRTIPIISIVLLLLVYRGDVVTVYYTSFLVCFPVMFEALYRGFSSVNKDIIDATRLNAKINFYVFFKVHVPLSLPFILMSVIQSFGLGFKVVVMSEFLTSTKWGIGREFSLAHAALEQSEIFAFSFLMITIVIIFDSLLRFTLKKCMQRLF